MFVMVKENNEIGILGTSYNARTYKLKQGCGH